ncbi:MAG: glycosyltransferase [Candidatus Anstonellaceae archaeon]
MKINLFTGYFPDETFGLGRYSLNLYKNLDVKKNIVYIKSKQILLLDIIKYFFIKYPEADMNHLTTETFGFILLRIRGKKIATVFDLHVLRLKSEYGIIKRLFYLLNLIGLKRADHIITASKFMRNILINEFGFKDNKISVIYLGLEKKFILKPKKLKRKKEFQIIYVGSEKHHKKFIEVLETLKILNKNNKKIKFKLIKIGKPQSGLRKFHLQFVKENNLDVQFIDHVEDKNLIELYKSSDIFITMSDSEGFCLPPLEAAGAGLPLVLKDNPVLKEVYSGVAEFVSNPQQAAKKIMQILSNKKKYENLSKKGCEFAKKMDWKKYANKVKQVYIKVLKNE